LIVVTGILPAHLRDLVIRPTLVEAASAIAGRHRD